MKAALKHKSSENNFPLQKYYSKIHHRYDLVNRLFTFGMDKRWRRITVLECLEGNPAKVLDLCCGTGDLAIELRKLTGMGPEITGYDLSFEMLQLAAQKSKEKDYTDVTYLQGDVAEMPFPDAAFDAITIGFGFRNLTFENSHSDKHLSEISRVMKKGGKLCILESAVPSDRVVKLFYRLYLWLILVPLGGMISGDWKAYRYLARSSANFYSSEQIHELLHKKDLEVIRVRRFFLGAANLIVAEKR